MIVQLGNAHPIHTAPDDTSEHWTTVEFPEGLSVAQAVVDVTDQSGVWTAQSHDPAPAWVASDTPDLEAALAAHYDAPTRSVSGINA